MARRGGGSVAAVSDRTDASGGGLTGATGHLTPDASERPFVPAERREMEDRQGEVTASPARLTAEELSQEGNPVVAGDATDLAQAAGGYASRSGLAGDDPAYRMEQRPVVQQEAATSAPDDEVQTGGDEVSDRPERL